MMKRFTLILNAALGIALAAPAPICAATLPNSAAELFSLTNVWNVRLTFTEQQWADMEPRDAGGPGFGGFGGGPRGPGGPGGFGPAMFIAPAFIREGDADKDGKLSKDEFAGLGAKWFTAWDAEKTGKVNADQLRAGLNKTLGMPGPGGPGGPGGPPRGPMGFGARGLQGREGQRNGIAANMEFEYVHADFEFEDKAFKNVAARYKGNGTFLQSRRSDKKPMKVDLNKYVKGQKLAGISTINLHNSVTDPSWMNEVLSYQLYRDAGVPAPRTAYARVSINAPPEHKNDYFGLYCLVENIDSNFTEDIFKIEGGGIFKPVTPNLFADLGDNWESYNQTYDPKEASKKDKQRIIDTCKFVSKSDEKEFAEKIGDYIELDQFARYLAVTVFLSDLDGILGPGQNFYLFLHPKTQKFTFIAWDQDHSFGQMRGSQEERERLSIDHPWMNQNPFLERMFKVAAFKEAYRGHLEKFSKTIFKPERFHKQVDELAAVIRSSVKEESEDKLRQFDNAIAGKFSEEAGFRPFGGGKPVKPFVVARAQSIAAQVSGEDKGLEVGGDGFGGGRRGGPGGFGPGMFLGNAFMTALDADKSQEVTAEETSKGFEKWFEGWNLDKSGSLTEEQLRAGINKDLSPFPPGGGPPGFGPPRR